MTIGGCDLAELAEQYGTPLYLYDRATLDAAVTQYRQTLAAEYPASSGITYAGKAFLCTAIAQWAQQQDLLVDCTGAGELAIAAAAQVARRNILVHGVNKSPEDMQAALAQAGVIVVDNLPELERLDPAHPGSQHPAAGFLAAPAAGCGGGYAPPHANRAGRQQVWHGDR